MAKSKAGKKKAGKKTGRSRKATGSKAPIPGDGDVRVNPSGVTVKGRVLISQHGNEYLQFYRQGTDGEFFRTFGLPNSNLETMDTFDDLVSAFRTRAKDAKAKKVSG